MNKERIQSVVDHWTGNVKTTAKTTGLTERQVWNVIRTNAFDTALFLKQHPSPTPAEQALDRLREAFHHWRKQSEDPTVTGCHRNAALRECLTASARLARAEGWMPHGNARSTGKKGKAFLASVHGKIGQSKKQRAE